MSEDALTAEGTLVFELQLDAGAPWYDAHFPGLPIVPGVVLLDALQAGCRRALAESLAGELAGLRAVRHLRFLAPVTAPLVLAARAVRRGEWWHCELATAEGAAVLRAQLRFGAAQG